MAPSSTVEDLISMLQKLNSKAIKKIHGIAIEEIARQTAVEEFIGGVFMNLLAASSALSIQAAGTCASTCRAWSKQLPHSALMKIVSDHDRADWKNLGLRDALVKAAVREMRAISHSKIRVQPSDLQEASLKAALNGSDVVCRGAYGSGQAMTMLLAVFQLLSESSSCSFKNRSVLILSRDVHVDILGRLCRKLAEDVAFKVEVCVLTEASQFNAALDETRPARIIIGTPTAALRELVLGHQVLQTGSAQRIFIYHCSARLDEFGNEEFLSGYNTPIDFELGALLRLEQQMQGDRQVCIFGMSCLPGPSEQEVYKQWIPHPVLIGDWRLPSWMPQNSRMLTWQATPQLSEPSTNSGSTEQVAVTPHSQLVMAVNSSLSTQPNHTTCVPTTNARLEDAAAGDKPADLSLISESCALPRSLHGEQQREISAVLAAHQYIRLLQQERGKSCWALVSGEGRKELETHQQIIQVKLEEVQALTRGLCIQNQSPSGASSVMWAGLLCTLEEEQWYRSNSQPDQQASKFPMSGQGPLSSGPRQPERKRTPMPDLIHEFDEVFAQFNGRVSEIIEAVASAVSSLPAAGKLHDRYRFCSTAGEQLGRERAFLCTFLERSKALRADPILMRRISEITGARKLLFGTTREVGLTGDVVVRGPGGLAGLLGLDVLGKAPLLPWEDLAALENLEARVFYRKGGAPPVREWYLLLTRLMDSIHTRIERELAGERV